MTVKEFIGTLESSDRLRIIEGKAEVYVGYLAAFKPFADHEISEEYRKSAIFTESFLSFIGLGVQAPMTSWGSLASNAQQTMAFYPYQLFFPAFFIALTMLSFQLLGDGLRDALDPKLRQ